MEKYITMRAIWKGHIRFSLVTIPVRIYGAIDAQQTISFNQINKNTNNPIRYEKKDKGTGETVKSEDIVKGYQYEPGQYVILDPEDFEKVKLKSTRVIEIEGFVDAKEVHPALFDTPYFAGPDGEVAAKTYSLLCKTLKESGKLGIGRVVLRDRENVMLLAPEKKGILLYKLRYPEELRNMADVPDIAEGEADKEQLKLAKMLVDNMTTKFDKLELKNRYNDALKEIIDQKIEGKEIVVYEEEEAPVVDIMTALKESINQAKEQKKPMKKATGKEKEVKSKSSTPKKKKKTA